MFTHSHMRWYLGLCGAWDKGPVLFEVKVIPQTMLVVIAHFSFLWHPSPPPSFFSREMKFGGCRWGAFIVYVCFPPATPPRLLSDPSQTIQLYLEMTEYLDVFVNFSEKLKKRALVERSIGSTCSSICFSFSVGLGKNLAISLQFTLTNLN